VVQLVEGIDFNIQDYRSTAYSDLFAEYGINYLMVSKIPGIEGAMFWEQRTTQRVPSATRELNVMRFITVINRTIVPILRTFIFEPNHPVIWREIHRVLQPAFDDWKQKYAIYDYCLQTDRDAFFDGGVLKNAVLNSGLDIDRGIYRCRALIQPTRAIYYLDFELGVLRTGENFENYTSTKYLPGWVRQ
jgi:phage tail sheath protein FI